MDVSGGNVLPLSAGPRSKQIIQHPEIHGNISTVLSWSPPVGILNLSRTISVYRNIGSRICPVASCLV
jgi:hypothetical protein